MIENTKSTQDGLARKYRPHFFKNVIGQDIVVEALQNSLQAKHSSQAYLFFGPRGTGKTSLARLIARRVNCSQVQNNEPCGKCKICIEIENGNSMDILEIDAASHRGIDYIRELRANIKFQPMYHSKKVYIIDEVHMLTMESFNALLKTLEEPPPHAIFVLATTEYHKVPPTILSRCQIFNLKKLSLAQLEEYIEEICKKENIKAEKEALFWIAQAGDGSLRDTLSFLEQSIHYCGDTITNEKIKKLLGKFSINLFIDLSLALLDKKSSTENLLQPIHDNFAIGINLKNFVWDYLNFLRILICIKKNLRNPEFLGLPETQILTLEKQFSKVEYGHLYIIFREVFGLLHNIQNLSLQNSYEIQSLLEILLIETKEKLQRPSLSGVLQKLNQFGSNSFEKSQSFEDTFQKEFSGTLVDSSNKEVNV